MQPTATGASATKKRRLGFERIERFLFAISTESAAAVTNGSGESAGAGGARTHRPVLRWTHSQPEPHSRHAGVGSGAVSIGAPVALGASALGASAASIASGTSSKAFSLPLRTNAVDACFCFNLLNVRVVNRRLLALERARSGDDSDFAHIQQADRQLEQRRAANTTRLRNKTRSAAAKTAADSAKTNKKRRRRSSSSCADDYGADRANGRFYDRPHHDDDSDADRDSDRDNANDGPDNDNDPLRASQFGLELEPEPEPDFGIDSDSDATSAKLERNWLQMQRLTCELRRALLIELARVVRPNGE